MKPLDELHCMKDNNICSINSKGQFFGKINVCISITKDTKVSRYNINNSEGYVHISCNGFRIYKTLKTVQCHYCNIQSSNLALTKNEYLKTYSLTQWFLPSSTPFITNFRMNIYSTMGWLETDHNIYSMKFKIHLEKHTTYCTYVNKNKNNWITTKVTKVVVW